MSEAQVLHFFGGKGGAGKTTLATAFALNLSEKVPKESILLVALEPVGALSDLLKKRLTQEPTKILGAPKGNVGLSAAELAPADLLRRFVESNREAVEQCVRKGALLSQDELTAVLRHWAPGLEDLAALLHLMELLESNTFEKIVVDGFSTGQTLRLFDLPGVVRRFITLVRGKGEKARREAAVVDGLVAQLDRLTTLLKDPARMSFHLTTLAEPVPEAQTRHLFNGLRERSVPIRQILVNQVEDGTGCPACHGRRGLQAPHVRKYQALDKTLPVHLLGKREVAPHDLDALRLLAREWATGKETKALEFAAAEGPPALVRAPSMPPIAAPPLPPTRLIFFVGQGGGGKSSCAAAAAVTLTEKEGPVLLISTDTSHSLSDVLQSRLTDTESQVKGTKGLYARELDMAGWFNGLRKRLREKADKAFGPEPKGQEVPLDREVLRNLLDTAPPGIDELAAMSVLTDALIQERFKRIVVDVPPSGSAVRLIELPELIKPWLSDVHAVLSRHRGEGLGELADEVSSLLKHVKRFEDALGGPVESRFVVVTRGDELSASRAAGLVAYLKGRKVAVERVLVNRVIPKSTCDKCENRRKNELLAAKNIEKEIGLPVTVAPALGRHPAGLRELKAFRTSWYALSAPAKIKAA